MYAGTCMLSGRYATLPVYDLDVECNQTNLDA